MTSAEFKTIRNQLGFTQLALARLLGCKPRNIRRYEAGKSPIPLLVSKFMSLLSIK